MVGDGSMANSLVWSGILSTPLEETTYCGTSLVKIFDTVITKEQLIGATVRGDASNNLLSVNTVLTEADLTDDNFGFFLFDGWLLVVTEDYADEDGSFSKGMWMESNTESVYQNIIITVPNGGFALPEVYRPYVNTAKKLYEQYVGLGVEDPYVVAENENYISVQFLTEDFKIVDFDADTGAYTATGITFVTYDKRTDLWGDIVDNRTTTSEGTRYYDHWIYSDSDIFFADGTIAVPVNREGWYYNSVKLPNIDDVWTDKETYRCASMAHIPSMGTYGLFLSGNAFIYSSDVPGIKMINSCKSQVYILNDGKWVLNSSADIPAGTEYNQSVYVPHWASYDVVYNSLTDVFLPASEPVHVTYVIDEGYDETSFKIGLTLGLCGKGIVDGELEVAGESVQMYSYNGTMLPALPEWDKTTYPYAYIITDYPINGGHGIIVSSIPLVAIDGVMATTNTLVDIYGYIEGMGLTSWVHSNSCELTEGDGRGNSVIWCSSDIFSDNGSLYLEASDPVPVETFTIDQASFLAGYKAGAELRRLRKSGGGSSVAFVWTVYDDYLDSYAGTYKLSNQTLDHERLNGGTITLATPDGVVLSETISNAVYDPEDDVCRLEFCDNQIMLIICYSDLDPFTVGTWVSMDLGQAGEVTLTVEYAP